MIFIFQKICDFLICNQGFECLVTNRAALALLIKISGLRFSFNYPRAQPAVDNPIEKKQRFEICISDYFRDLVLTLRWLLGVFLMRQLATSVSLVNRFHLHFPEATAPRQMGSARPVRLPSQHLLFATQGETDTTLKKLTGHCIIFIYFYCFIGAPLNC